MVKKPSVIVAGVLVLALVIYLLIPQDERLIRRHLSSFADTLDVEKDETIISAALAAKSAAGYFVPDAVIHVGNPVPDLSGRKAITQAAIQGRQMLQAADFDFRDLTVEFKSDTLADVLLTATATFTTTAGETDYHVREMRITLRKVEGDWSISQVETVKTLE